jgi:hypothetical protein
MPEWALAKLARQEAAGLDEDNTGTQGIDDTE